MGRPVTKEESNRREHRRIRARIPVNIVLDGESRRIEAELLNISEGGAFLACDLPLTMGQNVEVEIKFKENSLIKGKIVDLSHFRNEFPSESPERTIIRWVQVEQPKGVGVEFLSLSEEKRAYLQKLMDYYELLQKAGVQF